MRVAFRYPACAARSRVTRPHTFMTWEEFDRHHREPFVARVRELVARVGS
jgi:hypothetical protein